MAVSLVIIGMLCGLTSVIMTAGVVRAAVLLGIALWMGFGVFAILALVAAAKIRANPLFSTLFQGSKGAKKLAFLGFRPHI